MPPPAPPDAPVPVLDPEGNCLGEAAFPLDKREEQSAPGKLTRRFILQRTVEAFSLPGRMDGAILREAAGPALNDTCGGVSRVEGDEA